MNKILKTGILGGTFNPVHKGHIEMAERALSDFGLDKVLFMPDGKPPYKKSAEKESISDEDRLNLLKIATASESRFEVSNREISKKKFSYTSDTLFEMKSENPEEKLYFITGSDSFLYIDKWHDPDVIMKSAVLCVYEREAAPDQINLMNNKSIDVSLNSEEVHDEVVRKKKLFEKIYGAEVLLSKFRPPDISSSKVRRLASSGKDISGLVPYGVAEYIEAHHLYR